MAEEKVVVEKVVEDVNLSPETIEKIGEATSGAAAPASDAPRGREGRSSDPMAAKAVNENVTTSTIENISTPHQREEEGLTSRGQRWVNLIWEFTQAIMTIMIVYANIRAAFEQPALSATATATLNNAMFVVLGFYYGRTNHQRVGGVQQGR